MKVVPSPSPARTSVIRGLAVATALLVPPSAQAAEWIVGTGAFGDDANWNTGSVPLGEPASIINGGTAQISDGAEYFIGLLTVGGHSGVGSLEISNGSLTATGGPHNVYFGGDDTEGGTGVGNLTMSGGTLAGSGGEMLFGTRGGTANITMTGGTITSDNWLVFGRDTGGVANLTLSGGATIQTTGANPIGIGYGGDGRATVSMTDSALISSNTEVRIGYQSNGTTTVGMSGDSRITATGHVFIGGDPANGTSTGSTTVNMSGDSRITTLADIRVGYGNTNSKLGVLNMVGSARVEAAHAVVGRRDGSVGFPNGELHMSGDTTFVVTTGNFSLAHFTGAKGLLTMTDNAAMTVAQAFYVGRERGSGVATLGGSAVVNAGTRTFIGHRNTGNTQGDGILTLNDSAQVISTNTATIGFEGATGTLTMNGNSRFVAGAGAEDPTGAGISVRGKSTINLNGGTIETPGFRKFAFTEPVININLNGGTIKVTGNMAEGNTFFQSIENNEITIQAGGARFDTNGHNITIIQNLAGVGGLTKLGAGVLALTGAPSYLGDTAVAGGTLSITTGFLADGANVWLAPGSVFDLNFAGTDTINALFIDGVAQELGTWGGMDSTATHKSALFTGVGVLEVTSVVPEPSSIVLLCAGLGFAVLVLRRRKASSPA